jgi:hypothetical protein
VVALMRSPRAATGAERFAHIGPFSVARASRTALQACLATAFGLVIALAITCAVLLSRLSRARQDLQAAQAEPQVAPGSAIGGQLQMAGPIGSRASLAPGRSLANPAPQGPAGPQAPRQ